MQVVNSKNSYTIRIIFIFKESKQNAAVYARLRSGGGDSDVSARIGAAEGAEGVGCGERCPSQRSVPLQSPSRKEGAWGGISVPLQKILYDFYRAMHVVLARYCYRNVVRPSVRLSVRP